MWPKSGSQAVTFVRQSHSHYLCIQLDLCVYLLLIVTFSLLNQTYVRHGTVINIFA